MKFWAVSRKYFDSGAVKVNVFRVTAEAKPESGLQDNSLCEHYVDYFDTYREALGFRHELEVSL